MLHICEDNALVIIFITLDLFEKLKYQSCNTQNRRSYELENIIFDTYKNSVMPHGKNIVKTESDTNMATVCAYPSSK